MHERLDAQGIWEGWRAGVAIAQGAAYHIDCHRSSTPPPALDLNLNPKSRGNKRSADAYERLLLDVIKGDQTLFLRQDELEQAWHWVDPILETWERTTSPPEHYASGSWGPAGSTLLLAKDGRLWFEGANGQGN